MFASSIFMQILSPPYEWILRSISGYIPLDFAVVGKKKNWKLARMLDDRRLLPRAEFPRLEKCIIEVWRKKHKTTFEVNCSQTGM